MVGSPPPMRGKAVVFLTFVQCLRITPAYAGKRSLFQLFLIACWDHPRLCGEKKNNCRNWCCWIGSPPPMRGKDEKVKTDCTQIWITPAYAGKSLRICYRITVTRDHPRLCGEKKREDAIDIPHIGSPPPMRGKA